MVGFLDIVLRLLVARLKTTMASVVFDAKAVQPCLVGGAAVVVKALVVREPPFSVGFSASATGRPSVSKRATSLTCPIHAALTTKLPV